LILTEHGSQGSGIDIRDRNMRRETINNQNKKREQNLVPQIWQPHRISQGINHRIYSKQINQSTG
jgi:hypothetical protein